MTNTDRRRRPRSRVAKLAARTAVVIAATFTVVVVALLILTAFPPAVSAVTIIATTSWAIIGPWLALAALIAVVLLVAALWQRVTRARIVFAALAVVALIGSTVITASIAAAGIGAGASIDIGAALRMSGPPVEPDETETYLTTDDGTALDALIFTPDAAGEAAPVLMYIHGGGWISGAAADSGSVLREYADAGFLVVSVEYALATDTAATWDVAPPQLGCALTWTAANAERWGGDPTRLFVMGDSAGGNLAVNLAWSAGNGDAQSACPEAGEVPRPSGAIAAYPVINPANAYDDGKGWLFDQKPQDFTRQYLGGTPAEHPERLAAISSETYISPKIPPTLIFAAERDDFIPAAGIYDVVDEADAQGAPVSLVRVPFSHHIFDAFAGSLGDQVKRTTAIAFMLDTR